MKRDHAIISKPKLRKQAEEALQGQPDDAPELSEEKMRHHIQELRVHQIELEMQNEELRRTQIELQAARDKYADLYDFAPVGYFTISAEGMILEANLTGASMLGVERGLLSGSPFSKFINSDDQDIYYLHLQELIETKNEQTRELRLVKKDGSQFYAQMICLPVFDENGNLDRVRVAATDITALKQVEETLRENEERYRAMMEAMHDAAYISSPDFRIEYMNPRMISRIGKKATGEICHKAIYNNDEKCSWCVFDQVRQGEHVVYELANPNDKRYYSVSNSPIFYSDKNISKLTVFRDITTSKEIESQLRQARKMEAIGTLTGGIAHDFNNILSVILGNAELALEDIPELNPEYFNLEEIKKAGLRAASIVRQLLSFSRKTDELIIPIEIIPVIKDALKFLRSTIPATIEIRKNIPALDISVIADPIQINQIMMNLCINASQEMEQTGGIIEINVENVSLDKEKLKGYMDLKSGNYVKVSVSDTGPGIDTEIIDRIFDPYFTTKEVGKGSGMGLAVVHGIVKNYRGAITVDSKLGKGSTFTVLFPIPTAKPEIEIEKTDVVPFGNETILFVDDENSVVNMTSQVLERLGYQIEAKLNPVEALELFQSKPDHFDLVITDMTMPQMTGVKLYEKLMRIRSDIPVIICSGHSALIDEDKAKQLGIDAFVMKPILKREIAKIIREVLDKSK